MASPPPYMSQAYTPPLSLWRLIEQNAPPFEKEELKSMLGSHIVDQSLELHSEIEMLLEIWQDMRDELKEERISGGLPEPPNQRDRLIQEINFFVQNVKDKAKQKGINPDHIFKHHKRDIIEYAHDQSRPGSSIGRSSRSSDGRETPMMVTSPDRISRAFEVTDEVEAVNEKLNVNEFDKVCAHLRATLEKEVEQLVSDLEFLQGCLDNEADVRDSITPRTSREPTLTELREERASLEKELLLSDNLTPLPDVQNRMSLPSTIPKIPMQQSPPQSKPLSVKATQSFHGKWNSQHRANAVTESSMTPRSGKDIPIKASHDLFTKTLPCEKDRSHVQSDSESIKDACSMVPTPPSASRSDSSVNKRVLPNAPHVPIANTPKISLHERSLNDGVAKPRMASRRKTPSPSRIRVVDLSSIVDIQTEKRDNSSLDCESQYDFASPVSSNFGVPSPAANVPDQSLGVRPSSADRFRKMVMGCRDGE